MLYSEAGVSGRPPAINRSLMSIVKMQHKGQMTIPRNIRSKVGLTDGDLVEVKTAGGQIVITPKLAIDRSKSPAADDEYTPAQRRIIDARLAKAKEDMKAGRVYGPFATVAELERSLRQTAKKYAGNPKRSARS
jgi:AbrB family looped-hinge helix DNA binding protein